MSLVRTVFCVAFAALAVCACSKSSDKAAPAPGAQASSGAQKDEMGPVIPASQLPAIRAGLWETTETTAGKKPRVDRQCESGKQKPLTMGKGCSELTLRRSLLGKYVIDTQCGGNGISVKLHMEAQGDFQSRYSLDTTSAIQMPGQPDQIDTSHREGRYLGPCPAGMAPADE
jgi:hypothetical protein